MSFGLIWIASLGTMLCCQALVTALMAVPWHAVTSGTDGELTSPLAIAGVSLGVLMGLAAGAAAVLIPLHYGARNLRQMEF